ncbi:hypothetical protein [Flavobacterium sp.]|uniref:hypothetical protein n=1 Tax=Flavobacterium sp. TaxID=239 RepID=UPI0026082A81|nr:hypothetical protein [Flavobacterium sp.]
MKTINFDYTGGFPLEQPVLKRMQSATLENLTVFVKHIGCEDVGNYVIYGCLIVGANITPGMMYIDGELCPFAGAVGTLATKIKKLTSTTNAPFENGSNPPVFIETTAVVDATGTALSAFTRFNFVNDPNYVHTDENFTAILLAKLNAIESGAEVNVQADWNVVNPGSDAYIKNKPVIENVLKSDFVVLGAMASNSTVAVNFPDVGTSDYHVVCSIESMSPFGSRSQDIVSYATASHTSTKFDFMILADVNTGVRNIKLHYKLIAN